jgi:excisionase family DNA binding protein
MSPSISTGSPMEHGSPAGAQVDHVWLTVKQSAEYAGVSTDTIYTACERGELRHARISGRRSIRLKAEWIDEWLEQFVCEPLTVRI